MGPADARPELRAENAELTERVLCVCSQDLCAPGARAERERVDRPLQGPEQRSVHLPDPPALLLSLSAVTVCCCSLLTRLACRDGARRGGYFGGSAARAAAATGGRCVRACSRKDTQVESVIVCTAEIPMGVRQEIVGVIRKMLERQIEFT